MRIEVKYFGVIAENIGCSTEQIKIQVKNQLNLRDFFKTKYPFLNGIDFKIAINQQFSDFISSNQSNAEVALLPPFSGG